MPCWPAVRSPCTLRGRPRKPRLPSGFDAAGRDTSGRTRPDPVGNPQRRRSQRARPPAHRGSRCGCAPRRSTANSRPHWPPTPPTSRSSGPPCVRWKASTTAATEPSSPPPSPLTRCGFTSRSAPTSWLLLRQHSPVLAHGRCFGRGDVLTEDGTLVASYAQEALLRFRDGSRHDDAKAFAYRTKQAIRRSIFSLVREC